MNKRALRKELSKLKKKEKRIIFRASSSDGSFISEKVNGIIPGKIKNKLDGAFSKAFSLIYEKGSKVIMKTYSGSKMEKMYEEDKAFANVAFNSLSIRSFQARSRRRWFLDLLISFASGFGLGLLGRGIISIPVFVSVTFRNIYQTALCYGFNPENENERYLMLLMMNASLKTGEAAEELSEDIDDYFELLNKGGFEVSKEMIEKEMKDVSESLSDNILYLKALQIIPVLGGIIGITDVHFFNKIHRYIDIKYRKRFLLMQVANG